MGEATETAISEESYHDAPPSRRRGGLKRPGYPVYTEQKGKVLGHWAAVRELGSPTMPLRIPRWLWPFVPVGLSIALVWVATQSDGVPRSSTSPVRGLLLKVTLGAPPFSPLLVGGIGGCSEPCPSNRESLRSELASLAPRIRRELARLKGQQRRSEEAAASLVFAAAAKEPYTRDRILNRALETLEGAVTAAPHDAALRSDLAAGYLIRAEARKDPRDLLDALDQAAEACFLDSEMPEAAHNRSLVLSRIGLETGREARDYLSAKSSGNRSAAAAQQWQAQIEGGDARVRWERTRARLLHSGPLSPGEVISVVQGNPQYVRLLLEDEILPSWGSALEGRNEPLAALYLARAESLAAGLASFHGDRRPARTVAQLMSAAASSRARLATGLREYGAARVLHEAQRYAEARLMFERSAENLGAGGSPFAFWPLFFLAVEEHHRPNFKGALERLAGLRLTLEADETVEHGYIAWMSGLSFTRLANREAALQEYRTALKAFEGAGQAENVAQINTDIAVLLDAMGRLDEGWPYHASALKAVCCDLIKARRALNVLEWAARGSHLRGRLAAAAVLQGEAVALARQTGNPLSMALALAALAELEKDLHQDGPAHVHLSEARQAAQRIPDPGLAADIIAGMAVTESRVVDIEKPNNALARIGAALEFVEARSVTNLRIPLLLEEARLQRELGFEEKQKRALVAALDEVERQREYLSDPDHRLRFLDQSRNVVDQLVAVLWDQGRPEEAFSAAERYRARVLGEAYLKAGLGGRRPSSIRALARSLAPGNALIAFHELDSRLLIWCLWNQGWTSREVPIDRSRLENLASEIRTRAAKGELDGPRLRQLSDLLLGPEILRLARVERLFFVPDGPLHAFPFALLQPGLGKEFLVERFSTAVCPAVGLCLDLEARARALEHAPLERGVLFTDFEPSRRFFPNLPTLKSSPEETARIGSVFRSVRHVRGLQATRRQFVAEALTGDVLYFGGHGIAGTKTGTALLLAPENEADDGWLGAGALRFQGPTHCRLAVLAACSTGLGEVSATEGPLSLARPFLIAGVPSVIASLWSVDDRATIDLFGEFFTAYQRGERDAWRFAQLAALRQRSLARPDLSWAAFSLFGGVA